MTIEEGSPLHILPRFTMGGLLQDGWVEPLPARLQIQSEVGMMGVQVGSIRLLLSGGGVGAGVGEGVGVHAPCVFFFLPW